MRKRIYKGIPGTKRDKLIRELQNWLKMDLTPALRQHITDTIAALAVAGVIGSATLGYGKYKSRKEAKDYDEWLETI